jgi:hypothetical protein
VQTTFLYAATRIECFRKVATSTGACGRFRCPGWAKALIDPWAPTGGITTGNVFRPVSQIGEVADRGFTTGGPIWNALMRYTADIGVPRLAPHDLRRCAGCEKPPGARTRAGMFAAVVCHLTIPI